VRSFPIALLKQDDEVGLPHHYTPVELMAFIINIGDALGEEAQNNFPPSQNGNIVAPYARIDWLKRDVGLERKTPLAAEAVAEWAARYTDHFRQ
jgi:hypothetical protein